MIGHWIICQATTPTTVELSERLAFEGPMPIAAAVVATLALLWLLARFLRREQQIIGRRNGVLFWLLRAVAVAVAIWMLLAPSNIRSQRSTTRQAIAIAVDTSLSMQTVDPPEASEDVRWALAAADDWQSSLTVAVDRALAAARMAEHRLGEALAALRDQQPEREGLESVARAEAALQRTRSRLQSAVVRNPTRSVGPTVLQRTHSDLQSVAALSERSGDNAPASSADESDEIGLAHRDVVEMLDSADFRSLTALAAGFERGQTSFQGAWREGLVDLQRQTAAVCQRLNELAQLAAASESSRSSISLTDTAAAPGRWSRLRRVTGLMDHLNDSVLPAIGEQADVRFGVFDSSFTLLPSQQETPIRLTRFADSQDDASATGGDADAADALPSTDIATALQRLGQLRSEQPLAAVFLVTDGAHNHPASPDPLQTAAQLDGTPVYVLPIGNTRRVRDVELKSVSAPSVVMKDDDVVIEAGIGAYDCDGERLSVELLANGRVIQERQLEVESASALLRTRFNARLDEVGTHTFQIRVAPLEDELSEENNFQQFEINVTRNQIRVLLADGRPRWEYRYLAHLFRRDANVECDELLVQPSRALGEGSGWLEAMPEQPDQWARYDVVMIGDVAPEQLSIPAQRGLVDFVQQRGGTLVMIAGQEAMPAAFVGQPLEALLPVTAAEAIDAEAASEGYAFTVTEDGWSHHALMIADSDESTRIAWDFINRHSPLSWLSPYRQAKPAARMLIAAVPRRAAATAGFEDHALLSWLPSGRGRSVFLASPETFRMRYLRGDRLHYRFWGQLLRWAIASDLGTGSELVRIRTDRPEYGRGDAVQVDVRLQQESGTPLGDAVVEVVAMQADAADRLIPLAPDPDEPGRYRAALDDLPPGIYRIEPRGDAVDKLLSTFDRDDEPVPAASFTVRQPLDRELLDTRSDRALAQQIADASGGQVLPPTAIAEVLEMLDLQPIVEQSIQRQPLWVQWKYLWIVLGCLLSEWIVRKHKGLS